MKCPKCGYLGFEHVERCRNCGYDFALTASASGSMPELSLRNDAQAMNPLDDLSMIDAAMQTQSTARRNPVPDLDRVFGAPETPTPKADPATVAAPPAAARREELPLFGPPIPDDEPLIKRASPPRQPLAVRRATPEIPRLRTEQSRTPSFDLSLDLEAPAAAPLMPAERALQEAPVPDARAHDEAALDAGVGARFIAVAVDLAILAIIDAIVIYFTMQICAIGVEDLGLLPKGPLIAFLFVQNGGYLVAFTAGGQTLGKMAAGIRVVPSGDDDASLDLGHAFLRTLMWVVLAVPAGLGFLTALLSRDHRGLHDRFAGTRVVRATV
jgi:uncharacterized RDD family membrane protein YckC